MDEDFALEPIERQMQLAGTVSVLEECNRLTEKLGLALSPQQMQEVAENRFIALEETGRVEFGEGILRKLILAFCDSPFISKETYPDILCELQEIFYYYKNESADMITDDDLIKAMKDIFNGSAKGSTAYLGSTALAEICEGIKESGKKKIKNMFRSGDDKNGRRT